MSVNFLNTDNFICVNVLDNTYIVKPNIGLDYDKREVNKISNEEIDTTISIRDKVKPIDVFRISKRYIEIGRAHV